MIHRVSLLLTGESLLNYLNLNLSAGVFLEHIESPKHLYKCLENDCGIPDIVLLGLKVQEPIRMAEHILAIRRGIKIVVFCKNNQQQTLHKAIRFSPFLNADVISYEYKDSDACLNQLQQLLAVVEKQKLYETTIAEAERKRAANSPIRPLVASYFDKLLDEIPIGILNLDTKGRIINLNRCALSLLGQSERNLASMELDVLFSGEDAKQIKVIIENAKNNEKKNNSLVVCLNKAIEKSYLEVSISPLLMNDSSYILTVIMQEVTDKVLEEIKRKRAESALEESEKQLRLVIDAIPDLIAYVDSNLTYQFNNKAYEKWYGLSRDQIKGKSIRQVIGDEPYSIIEPYVNKVISGKTLTFEEKVNYPFRGEAYIRSTFVPNFSVEGRVSGFFVLTSDITQSKNIEEGEKKHMLELAHASRVIMIGEMSTLLAHELSQPLTSIEAYSRACSTLVEKGYSDKDEILNAFESISTQAKRAQEMMHELRNFVKKDATRKSISINDLIQSAIRLLKIEFRDHDLGIELNLKDRLPLVMADRILIEQVLINLVKNALEAMQAIDKGNRSLILESELYQGTNVMISVHDSGPGLSDYELNKIFEPFYTTKPEGIGMGLAITRSIIDSHDGKLFVVPNNTGGTTFQFSLPITDNYLTGYYHE